MEPTNESWQNCRVGTVAIAVVVFGIPLALLMLLLKAVRKLMPAERIEVPSWDFRDDGPTDDGGFASDREPRRPLMPIGSGAIALALPLREPSHEQAPIGLRDQSHGGNNPGRRLAG